MKFFLDRLHAALSRWSLALLIAFLLFGIWAWLDVSLRMLPQPAIVNHESRSATLAHDAHQTTTMPRRVATPAR